MTRRVSAPVTIGMVAVAGLGLGVLTVYGQRLPGGWSALANSGAAWLAFAFAVGALMRSDPAAAAAGAGMLTGAVIGYYLAVPIVVDGAAANMRSVVIWTGTALIGGPVFGIAGRWWRHEPAQKREIALGLLGGVFVAEGMNDVVNVPTVRTAGWILLAVGVAIPIVPARSSKERLLGLAAMVPVALITFGAYHVINWSFVNL
jgi:Family of unknown function (DUF6518)